MLPDFTNTFGNKFSEVILNHPIVRQDEDYEFDTIEDEPWY